MPRRLYPLQSVHMGAPPPNLIWKDILHPGTQRDRFGVEFTITAADCRRAKHNLEKMLARGVRVPLCWEHQPTANPVEGSDPADRLADYAKHTFGEVRAARVDPSGVLWAAHEVPDEADRRQLLKTKFVSPKLFPSYSDSRGGEYRGTTVGHVAATPTPVQFWQKPFELSAGGELYLSYTPDEGAPVADDKKPDDKKPEGGAGGGDLSALIKALKAHGLNIPDGVDDLAKLTLVVQANGGTAAAPAEPDADDLEDMDDLDLETPDAQGATTAAGAPPMLMSDGRGGQVSPADLRLNLVRRAKRLFKTGRLARVPALKLQREAEAVQLSDPRAAADPLAAVLRKVEAFETLDANSAWAATGAARELSATRPGPAPKTDLRQPADKDAGDKFVSELRQRCGAKK